MSTRALLDLPCTVELGVADHAGVVIGPQGGEQIVLCVSTHRTPNGLPTFAAPVASGPITPSTDMDAIFK